MPATFDALRITEPPSLSSGSDFCTVKTTPLKIDTELVVQLRVGDLADARGLENRGVVRTPRPDGAHCRPPRRRAGRDPRPSDIALHTGGVVAEFLDRRLQFGLPAPGDEDVRALVDEPLRRRQSDAGRCRQ